MTPEYKRKYRIPVYDTDFRGKLFLHSLFNYVQDIAAEHAELLNFGRDDLKRDNRFWVLSRIYSIINRMPSWGEEIMLTTWPRGVDGLFAMREIEATDAQGNVLAAVTTSWVVVDITTRRPVRPDTVTGLTNREFSVRSSTGRNAGKVAMPAEPCLTSPPFSVKPGDLDVNLHVNNVKYIQWFYDSFTVDFLKLHEPASAEINYLSESVSGDHIHLKYDNPAAENKLRTCSVIRSDDGRELCRITTEWRAASN